MACPPLKWTEERRPKVEAALRSSRTAAEAATKLGETLHALRSGCGQYGFKPYELLGRGEEVTVTAPPLPGLTIDELLAQMKLRSKRMQAHDEGKRLIPVRIDGDQPVGLFGVGDLHLDDEGTAIERVEADATVVRNTPGMYGFCAGDLLNNWIGRLQRLYATQAVTATEGWMLVDWYFELVRDWLFVVLGNHDLWAGVHSPMPWIAKRAGLLTQNHDVRAAVRFSNGREVRVHCRHDFPGNSIYNDSHGLVRSALFGYRDHVKIAGHRHISSHQLVPEPDNGIAMHMIRVAGYKQIDDHATEGGFLKRSLGPAVTLVVNPQLPDNHPDLVKEFWDVREGAEYLTFLRKRRGRRAA